MNQIAASAQSYARDLDLNLLRVFAVVVEEGSVTTAAARLYLTQSAVSAALKRLTSSVGAPLFTKHGRGLVPTTRGQRLFQTARPLLQQLIEATVQTPPFDPATSTQTVRVGLSDLLEAWVLPALMAKLRVVAPSLTIVATRVQFRTLPAALSAGQVDVAITVADELPSDTRRRDLFRAGYTLLIDPRHRPWKRTPTMERYLEADHVVVSYNGDLRGFVEDAFGVQRRVRCSVASFEHVGAVVEGSDLVATIPDVVAWQLMQRHKHLRTVNGPFQAPSGAVELIWRGVVDDDPAVAFVRELLADICTAGVAAMKQRASATRRA